jgi:signal transduction histidine kinase
MGWIAQFKWNSIHARLLATYLLLTALGTTIMSSYVLWSFHAYFMRTRQADMENWAAAVSESVADALEEENTQRVEVLIRRFGAPRNVTLRVFDSTGRLLATSSPEIDKQVTDWYQVKGIREALQGLEARGITKGVITADDRLFVAKPILRNGELLGVLRMSITLQQFQRQFLGVIWTVLGSLVVTIFLCALLSERLARSLSKPIETMQSFAIRLGGGHFGDKLSIHQNNELDQLAIELNRMSERLASLDQERREFLAKVSHELRTPISNVQVTVEALRNGAIEEPELCDRFLQNVQDETKRLSLLIHDLLDLGRLEAGITTLEQQTIPLKYLVDRAVRAIEPRMQDRGVVVHQDVAEIAINGDSERLLQALMNVLDNAMKHSQAGDKVFVSGYRFDKEAILEIRDQGTGIHEKDLPHIFEQFYTADKSRRGTNTGLGLAISKRIVEAHGGSITVVSKAGHGATFTISLPVKF